MTMPDDVRRALFELQASCTISGVLSNDMAGKLIAALAMPHIIGDMADDFDRLELETRKQREALRSLCYTLTGEHMTPMEATTLARLLAFIRDLAVLSNHMCGRDASMLRDLINSSWPEHAAEPGRTS